MKARLLRAPQNAVNRGAFGSPTFFVGKEMFFGKDQLRDVEEARSSRLKRRRQSSENKCGSEGAITTAHSWESALTTAIDAISAADILAGLPKRISKVIVSQIANQQTDPALVEADRSWSYREFGGAVAAVAEDLVRLQIRSGDHVLLASENSVALAALIFACSDSMRGQLW